MFLHWFQPYVRHHWRSCWLWIQFPTSLSKVFRCVPLARQLTGSTSPNMFYRQRTQGFHVIWWANVRNDSSKIQTLRHSDCPHTFVTGCCCRSEGPLLAACLSWPLSTLSTVIHSVGVSFHMPVLYVSIGTTNALRTHSDDVCYRDDTHNASEEGVFVRGASCTVNLLHHLLTYFLLIHVTHFMWWHDESPPLVSVGQFGRQISPCEWKKVLRRISWGIRWNGPVMWKECEMEDW